MFSRKMMSAMRSSVGVLVALVALASVAGAQAARDKIRIPVGRAEVVSSTDDVRTVAIAEPKIADAAVGSAKTVVVTAKSAGVTTLVVYNEGARYKVYDVECYVPNGDKQVALHVRLAEVNNNAQRDLGFDWAGEHGIPGQTDFWQGGLFTTKVSSPSIPLTIGPATDGALHYQPGPQNWFLQTTWKLLESQGDLRTLANSTLMARSGEKASFLSGGEIAIPIASGATSTGGATAVTIEWKEFGVKLAFTPIVEENNSITLKVAPEVSALDYSNALALTGYLVPTVISRKASTTVNLNAGEHLIIGGLKQTNKVKKVTRIPIIGRIPLLGFFFTNTHTENVETDLLVVVSPELVEAASTTLPALPTDRKSN